MIGFRGLSVAWSQAGSWTSICLRGSVDPGNVHALLTAIDAALSAEPAALLVEGDLVTSWSVRGLEVVVHTAMRAAAMRVGFALSGLGTSQVELIRRQWPGVPIDQFTHQTAGDATRALGFGLHLAS